MINQTIRAFLAIGCACSLAATMASAGESESNTDEDGASVTSACAGLPSHHALQTALEGARAQSNGGFNLDM
jgi:hypothetical protein